MIIKERMQAAIAANLKRLRGDRSQAEIARLCTTPDWKCYPATIQQIESGCHLPSLVIAHHIAEVLGVSIDELLQESTPRRRNLSRAS